MKKKTVELSADELGMVSGGVEEEAMTYEQAFDLVKRLVKAARAWNRSFENTLSVAVFVCGKVMPEADIEVYSGLYSECDSPARRSPAERRAIFLCGDGNKIHVADIGVFEKKPQERAVSL